MKIADAWIKLLFVYGPFAILVFLVIVTERKLRLAIKDTSGREKKTYTRLYILNWLAIFSLVIFSVYAWKRLNLDRKPTIEGRIESLSNLETLTTSSADLYLHRIRLNTRYSDYEWILVNKDKRFEDGAKIKFTIDRSNSDGGDGDVYEYELPIQSDFYDKAVQLRREKDKLFWDRNGEEIELRGRTLPQATQPLTTRLEPTTEFFSTVAYAQAAQTAQTSFSAEDFAVGLESPDALVRRNTRAELAKQGQAAMYWIEDILANPKSSYRLKLGVIVALNNMPNLRADTLKPSTISAIKNAAADPDDALRNEALGILSKYGYIFDASQPVTVYEHINFAGRSQSFAPGKYRADGGQLGNLPNDSASSLRVTKGYRVRLCENEGKGNGAGRCQEFGEGSFQLKGVREGGIGDIVSYIYVFKSDEARPSQNKTSNTVKKSG
jgi:hypothetical protein